MEAKACPPCSWVRGTSEIASGQLLAKSGVKEFLL